MLSITTHRALDAAIRAAQGTTLCDRLQAYAPQFAHPVLKDQTQLIVIESGDCFLPAATELLFSPLINPVDGAQYGDKAFHPYWDGLVHPPGWFEMTICIGSNFAFLLLISDDGDGLDELQAMCREFAD